MASGVIRVQIKAQLLTGLQPSNLPCPVVPSPLTQSPKGLLSQSLAHLHG